VANALSRRAHEVHIAAIIMNKTDIKYQIIGATNSYQNYLKIIEILQLSKFSVEI
jgi:hypothetical protein